jgi:hypothetical protein
LELFWGSGSCIQKCRNQIFLQEMFRDKLKNRDESITIGPLTLPTGKEILKPVAKLETGPDGVRYLEMGNRGLMLNVITPLQKFSKGGATISDVLKQRFQDTFQREMSSELLIKTEEVFTKKKEVRKKLQTDYKTSPVFGLWPCA